MLESEPLWTVDDLARWLQVKPATIKTRKCKAPETLPPPIRGMGKPRWLPSVCMEWARQQSEPPMVRKGGRPRKIPA